MLSIMKLVWIKQTGFELSGRDHLGAKLVQAEYQHMCIEYRNVTAVIAMPVTYISMCVPNVAHCSATYRLSDYTYIGIASHVLLFDYRTYYSTK